MVLFYLMTSPDKISPATNNALREATSKYFAKIVVPKFIKGIDGFAEAHLKQPPSKNIHTLVTTYTPDNLSIRLDDEDETHVLVEVDLDTPEAGVASIVAPGWYDEHGNWDMDNGQMVRKVVRALTEQEGRELTMDLYSLMSKDSDTK